MDKTISVIGMPMDLGQARRGVDMGPSAIRYAHLIERLSDMGYTVEDLGDIPINREKIKNDEELKNLNSVLAGNEKLAQRSTKSLKRKNSRLSWAVTTVLRSARWQAQRSITIISASSGMTRTAI